MPGTRGTAGADAGAWGGVSCGFKRCGATRGLGQGSSWQLVDALTAGWMCLEHLHPTWLWDEDAPGTSIFARARS